MKKRLVLMAMLSMVLALGLVLTGCGDSGSGDPTSPGGGEQTGGNGDNTGGNGDNTGGNGDNTGGNSDNTGGNGGNTGGNSDNTGGNGGNTGGGTTVPSAPTGVSATALTSSIIRITWNAVSGATSYKIYYGSSSSTVTSLDGTSTTTSFISTGNPAGATSYFKVSAVNSAGEGAKSSTVSATTSGGGSYGSLTIVNSSSHVIRDFTIYQSGYNLISGTGFYLLTGSINAGSSQTFTNVPAGSYVRIGSDPYGGYKVSKDTTWTVTSGQTTTLTIQSTWVVAN